MSLAPGIFIAHVDTRIVVLDVGADRYRLIAGRKAALMRRLASGLPVDDDAALDALVEDGVLTGPAEAPVEMARNPAPQQSAIEMSTQEQATLSVVATARTVAAVMMRQRRSGFAAVLRWARNLKPALPVVDAPDVVAFAQTYDRVRMRLPFKRICLRDSLALYALLRRRGIACNLVFGVRLDPFGAHCWVQSDDIILTDTLWSARPMQPILVL